MSDWIDFVVRDLCEIPDRDSPENAPEMIMASAEEIRAAIQNRANQRIADLERQLAAMQPMIEKAEAKAKEHQGWFTAANDHRRCDCAPCQWYRDYEARKPEDK